MATILRKKHLAALCLPSTNHEESIAIARAPVLPSRFVPKPTPENEPLSSYASATKKKKKKKKKMEKIEGQEFDMLAMVSGQVFRLVR